ncbi:MAG: thrombospondin type 3 repeat-containing protein, partial [Polyangiaceae bacterium]
MEATIRKSFDFCGFPEKGCASPTALHVIDGFSSTTCRCVEDPNPTAARDTDVDDDGRPDALDNCPFAFNPNQENCNATAETVRGAAVLGDACDPVPCPATYAMHSVPGAPIPPAADPDCTKNPVPEGAPPDQVTYACTKTAFNDQLVSDPVGSNAIDTNVRRGQAQVPTIVYASTSHRFCQNGPQFGIDCSNRTYVDDSHLHKPSSADAEKANSPDAPWHRITTGTSAPVGRDVQYSWAYGQTHAALTWFHATDVDYWLTGPNAPKVPFPTDDPTCANGDCLDGNMWLHADTQVGADTHGPGLANTYFLLQLQVPLVYCPTGRTYFIAPPAPPGGNAPIRPGPAPVVAQAIPLSISSFVLWQAETEPRRFDLRAVPDTELLANTSFGVVAAIQDNGSAVAVEPVGSAPCGGSSIGLGLKAQMVARIPWLNAIESNPNIGVVPASLLAVAISPD